MEFIKSIKSFIAATKKLSAKIHEAMEASKSFIKQLRSDSAELRMLCLRVKEWARSKYKKWDRLPHRRIKYIKSKDVFRLGRKTLNIKPHCRDGRLLQQFRQDIFGIASTSEINKALNLNDKQDVYKIIGELNQKLSRFGSTLRIIYNADFKAYEMVFVRSANLKG